MSSFRALLAGTPFGFDDPGAAEKAAITKLDAIGISDPAGREAWLADELDSWRENPAAPGIELLSVVAAAVQAGVVLDIPDASETAALLTPASISKLVAKLSCEQDLGWSGTCAVLGRLSQIARMAVLEKCSASRIAKVISSSVLGFPSSWRPVSLVLQALKISPEVTEQDIADSLARDGASYEVMFPDSTADAASGAVGRLAEQAGLAGELVTASLKALATEKDGEVIWPIIQTLHYVCVIAERYDHPLPLIYEFNPRGTRYNRVFDRYPTTVGNPVLNNAKSADLLDEVWARSKGSRSPTDALRPLALTRLLEEVDRLPWPTRRSICTALRCWCLLIIDLKTPPENPIDIEVTVELMRRVGLRLDEGSSGTHGVVEQRFVDAVVAHLWRPGNPTSTEVAAIRGLGFAAEEPNLTRARVGDADVQIVNDRWALGYEPTAGVLRKDYVDTHERTLRRSLEKRFATEWELIDPYRSNWSVEVKFVASKVDDLDLAVTRDFGGIAVTFTATTFGALLEEAIGTGDLDELVISYQRWVHDVLNERSRYRYRKRYLDLVERPGQVSGAGAATLQTEGD